jgi:hypothetical protein
MTMLKTFINYWDVAKLFGERRNLARNIWKILDDYTNGRKTQPFYASGYVSGLSHEKNACHAYCDFTDGSLQGNALDQITSAYDEKLLERLRIGFRSMTIRIVGKRAIDTVREAAANKTPIFMRMFVRRSGSWIGIEVDRLQSLEKMKADVGSPFSVMLHPRLNALDFVNGVRPELLQYYVPLDPEGRPDGYVEVYDDEKRVLSRGFPVGDGAAEEPRDKALKRIMNDPEVAAVYLCGNKLYLYNDEICMSLPEPEGNVIPFVKPSAPSFRYQKPAQLYLL